ncbi:UvrD-helicase domain-containing protein [Methylocystis sp. IM2]|uniref:UvrD-helicase domain-containing protein n=1 Tax=Methylocystis sp. IM2 TaxID=3136563 RepID=UPI0030FC20D5
MALVLCEQRQRLLRTDGNILVRGGAGSGKTTIALAKACADLDGARLGPLGKALFLSFARATVARIAEQATATLPRALISRIEINTYHGFAWTILKSHGYLLCAKQGVSLLLPAQARAYSPALMLTPDPLGNENCSTGMAWSPSISFRPC